MPHLECIKIGVKETIEPEKQQTLIDLYAKDARDFLKKANEIVMDQ